MVRRIFSFLHKEVIGVHNAAYLLGMFAFFSQLFALVRDRLLAHSFGAGQMLDIYYGAFRVPDFIFASIASLVSISVLIPFLAGKVDEKKEEAKKFMDNIFTAFFLLIIAVSIIAFFLLPYIQKLILPALVDPVSIERFVLLSRILLLQPIALGLSNLIGSITQVKNRFYIYAVSPLLYNIAIIGGITILYPIYGLVGIVIGVVIGSVFHVGVQIPYIFRLGLFPKFVLNLDLNIIKKVILISFPRTLTLSLSSIELIFITAYASFLGVGAISIFNFSLNLQSVPFAIIGVSYSLAAFPTLSKLFNSGEKEKFLNHIVVATRHIIFWSIPVMALFIVLRAQIVRVILGSGNFNWNDTRLTAACLALFVLSLVAQSLKLLFVRGYYASGNTRKPLLINVASSLLTIILPFVFIQLFNNVDFFRYFIESLFKIEGVPGSVVIMLPLGYSIGTIISMLVIWFSFSNDFKFSFNNIYRTWVQSISAAVIMGFVAYLFLNIFATPFDLNTLLGIFLQGLLSGLIAIVTGILILHLLKNVEIKEVTNILSQKIFKPRGVVMEANKIE
jgi:putative peptidoglycan lipid II flippase